MASLVIGTSSHARRPWRSASSFRPRPALIIPKRLQSFRIIGLRFSIAFSTSPARGGKGGLRTCLSLPASERPRPPSKIGNVDTVNYALARIVALGFECRRRPPAPRWQRVIGAWYGERWNFFSDHRPLHGLIGLDVRPPIDGNFCPIEEGVWVPRCDR